MKILFVCYSDVIVKIITEIDVEQNIYSGAECLYFVFDEDVSEDELLKIEVDFYESLDIEIFKSEVLYKDEEQKEKEVVEFLDMLLDENNYDRYDLKTFKKI